MQTFNVARIHIHRDVSPDSDIRSTGRAVTGIAHAANQTIIDFYSKKQNTVETSTYGSEFVAARTATDQIIDLPSSKTHGHEIDRNLKFMMNRKQLSLKKTRRIEQFVLHFSLPQTVWNWRQAANFNLPACQTNHRF